jgi:hypothetical protein
MAKHKEQMTSSKKISIDKDQTSKGAWSFRRFLRLQLFWSLFVVSWNLPAHGQAPATAPADQSTPQGALVLLARATQAGDIDGLVRLFHTTDATQKRYVETLAQQANAMAGYNQAVVKAFGQDVADKIANNSIDEERLRSAKAKIDGDKAVAQIGAGIEPYELVRVDGAWRVSPAQLTRGKTPAMVQQDLDQMKQLSDVLKEVSQELLNGKYKTPEQLDDAIRGKRLRAMSGGAPTTAPAQGR